VRLRPPAGRTVSFDQLGSQAVLDRSERERLGVVGWTFCYRLAAHTVVIPSASFGWCAARMAGAAVSARASSRTAPRPTQAENFVLELVLISADFSATRGTEAGPNPRFSPQMDLS
jgi:hypothetical protein